MSCVLRQRNEKDARLGVTSFFGGGQRYALRAALRLRRRRYGRALPPLAVLICSAFLHSLRSRISAQIRHGTFSPKGSRPSPLAKAKRRAFARLCFGGGQGTRNSVSPCHACVSAVLKMSCPTIISLCFNLDLVVFYHEITFESFLLSLFSMSSTVL